MNSKIIPYYYEFSGTPCSGKDSILSELAKASVINIIDESARKCSLPKELFDLEILWTVFDTYDKYKNLIYSHNVNNLPSIFNRGLFDRIAFIQLLKNLNDSNDYVSDKIENWLLKELNTIESSVFLFLTSYELAKERKVKYRLRPDSNFQIVNEEVITKLNSIYESLYTNYKNDLNIILIDERKNELSLSSKCELVRKHITSSSSRPL